MLLSCNVHKNLHNCSSWHVALQQQTDEDTQACSVFLFTATGIQSSGCVGSETIRLFKYANVTMWLTRFFATFRTQIAILGNTKPEITNKNLPHLLAYYCTMTTIMMLLHWIFVWPIIFRGDNSCYVTEVNFWKLLEWILHNSMYLNMCIWCNINISLKHIHTTLFTISWWSVCSLIFLLA